MAPNVPRFCCAGSAGDTVRSTDPLVNPCPHQALVMWPTPKADHPCSDYLGLNSEPRPRLNDKKAPDR
jgi:hypothetical protein